MAEPAVAEVPRRHLSLRQVQLVERLVAAAAAEAEAVGYDRLTVRSVARRAGVATATAYTYFSSKDHLLAEVLWRRFDALPTTAPAEGRRAVDRVAAVFADIGTFLGDEPALATAGTTALLGAGPDVRELRIRIGLEVHRRLAEALGEDVDEGVLSALELCYSGAMLTAGMGHFAFDSVPDRLAAAARLLLGAAP